jgi:membrane dipeptidase
MSRVIDLHLDLGFLASLGRNLEQPAAGQPDAGLGQAAVSLPELIAGGTQIIGATLYARAGTDATTECEQQVATYERLPMTICRSADNLDGDGLRAVLLMEGANPIDLDVDRWSPQRWFDRGVRIVGLAWGATRYAGGTGAPGPLTDDGRRLVPMLDDLGIIHDASHLAEDALDELLDLATGPIFASHSNCRVLVKDDPRGRHLPDRQIEAIIERNGIVGINLYDRFLVPPTELETRRATLADWTDHVRHVCDLAGDAKHVALGSDADGGFGRDHLPIELTTVADYPKLGTALSDDGFNDDDIDAILFANAFRFLKKNLP